MIPVIAVVILGVGVYARADFGTPAGVRETRAPLMFWTLLLAVWGALNLVFVSGDLFTLYVALELLTFAAVPLVWLDGRAETLRAAFRYLLSRYSGPSSICSASSCSTARTARWTSRCWPSGSAPSPRAGCGSADDRGPARQDRALPAAPVAAAGARRRPAAASAVLSGLVIKGSWFLVARSGSTCCPGS